MRLFLIEGSGNDYLGLFIIVIIIMLLPAIILSLIGLGLKKRKPKVAKVLFIIATVYVVISLGVCGSMM